MSKRENLILRRHFVLALLVLLISFAVATAATFAWYIYTINAHTTSVHMAAGAGASLQISNALDGVYGTAADLGSTAKGDVDENFVGKLNPVSTDRIQNGFQKVAGYTNGKENQPMLVANLFKPAKDSDYYRTSLFLRTNGESAKVYISGISFEDSSEAKPISTAIRVGLVVPSTKEEYVFAISDQSNPEKLYNTATGTEGFVLDSTKTDGTTIPFTPYTAKNFCLYDRETNTASLQTDSVAICTVSGDGSNGYGTPVQVDVYIWLEGCDEDCRDNLINETLKNIAISFAGV